ncbi:hypothetical protein [Antarcticirhabdus aurantiaca]|uniref:Uncharacterized protein n=1 Tax=Antarcticirhabdus aurantiaca TaxID=2606717 RepID=A0ACD4NLC4_9HYPH|nr:hypothetical protein [Antarcticirhabdus aurantiaca]WAJ27592.1 hypothetical protein OXU80_22530 [Jeongeuplla avenae]
MKRDEIGLPQSPAQAAEGDVLKAALERIVNPIGFMQKQAEATGFKLDGHMAMTLSNDANYLKGIAQKALDALSAEGSGTLAAASISQSEGDRRAKDMRERILQAIRETPVMADLTDRPDTFAEGVDAAEMAFIKTIRSLPLHPEKAQER